MWIHCQEKSDNWDPSKTGPQKTLENKNKMDRKRPCLENKKAKLLGQAHVAREN